MLGMKTWFLPSLLAAPVAAMLSLAAAGALAAEHDEVRNAVTAGRFRPLAEILQSTRSVCWTRVAAGARSTSTP